MSELFWQAKIWGLLHDPAFKALHNNTGRGKNSFWQDIAVMQSWVEQDWDPENSSKSAFKHIHLADFITSASDRGAIGATSTAINYNQDGLEVSHLLSGEKLTFRLPEAAHRRILEPKRADFLTELEKTLLPEAIKSEQEDLLKVFWWLWRCLPEAACQAFGGDESLLLMPAETRLPDSSIWNHASLTAAMAGALAGYDLTQSDIENWQDKRKSHPYLAVFSFTPVQELIKASRKMRDFWAGSWILHYLCAKVSWAIASKYGPDCLIYPNLFKQPLIDHWLLSKWPEFQDWIPQPSDHQLLTAGFPNVLVMVLPKGKVEAAMQMAEQTLQEEWLHIADLSFKELQDRCWMSSSDPEWQLKPDHKTWQGWLKAQWQTYWSAISIGKEGTPFKSAAIETGRASEFSAWIEAQNVAYRVTGKLKLFQDDEIAFLRAAYQQRLETQGRRFSVNVGSWWPYIFDFARAALEGAKNSRTWELPTAFGVRSTISGLGPVVHPSCDWLSEGEVKQFWKNHIGLFDGNEQLNATETVKRTLHKILPELLTTTSTETLRVTYPDLTAGVAGYLKTHPRSHHEHFRRLCRKIRTALGQRGLRLDELNFDDPWGVPWIDDSQEFNLCPSRCLSPSWLLEDSDQLEEQKLSPQAELDTILSESYPKNNPADWYVLAAGDGDGMSKWLKGKKLCSYAKYVASRMSVPEPVHNAYQEFLNLPKRMGPSTHSALSRALLDFSNQLVPYLTERRYAGRLIYSGGDDVLAYTNLWEWDAWLWDIRECFRGQPDPLGEFDESGHYWRWVRGQTPHTLSSRPLFTMGKAATISFGIVIAHHSVPLAIALENLWEAEKEGAKKYVDASGEHKDAVQVRVLYGNGNILQATTKFDVFNKWRALLTSVDNLEPALFEQAAQVWQQHPIPTNSTIAPWVAAFCDRRDFFSGKEDCKTNFSQQLSQFLNNLWQTTKPEELDAQVYRWLTLAAFMLRKRNIQIGG
jgi:CRISPR-associated protein Cmr2